MGIAARLVLIYRVLFSKGGRNIIKVMPASSLVLHSARENQLPVPVQGHVRVPPYPRIAFHQGILIQLQSQYGIGNELGSDQISHHIYPAFHPHQRGVGVKGLCHLQYFFPGAGIKEADVLIGTAVTLV